MLTLMIKKTLHLTIIITKGIPRQFVGCLPVFNGFIRAKIHQANRASTFSTGHADIKLKIAKIIQSLYTRENYENSFMLNGHHIFVQKNWAN